MISNNIHVLRLPVSSMLFKLQIVNPNLYYLYIPNKLITIKVKQPKILNPSY